MFHFAATPVFGLRLLLGNVWRAAIGNKYLKVETPSKQEKNAHVQKRFQQSPDENEAKGVI